MSQTRVSRATAALEQRKEIRIEGRRVLPQPGKVRLTNDERTVFFRGRAFINTEGARVPAPVRQQWFHLIAREAAKRELPAELVEVAFSRIVDEGRLVRTRFLETFKSARYQERQGYKEVTTRIPILIDQIQNTEVCLARANSPVRKHPANDDFRPPEEPPSTSQSQAIGTPEDLLFTGIAAMQDAFPRTSFGAVPISRESAADQILVGRVLEELQSSDPQGFLVYVAAQFIGIDCTTGTARFGPRSPDRPTGPHKLGLLIEWAKDYRRGDRGTRGATSDR